jgi:hypothetical protein
MTNAWAHPIPYLVSTMVIFPVGIAAVSWSWPLYVQLVSKLIMRGAEPPFPRLPSWCAKAHICLLLKLYLSEVISFIRYLHGFMKSVNYILKQAVLFTVFESFLSSKVSVQPHPMVASVAGEKILGTHRIGGQKVPTAGLRHWRTVCLLSGIEQELLNGPAHNVFVSSEV